VLCKQFDDGFDCEDSHEHVVNDLNRVIEVFRLHVPIEGQQARVTQNADHDEQVEKVVLGHDNTPFS